MAKAFCMDAAAFKGCGALQFPWSASGAVAANISPGAVHHRDKSSEKKTLHDDDDDDDDDVMVKSMPPLFSTVFINRIEIWECSQGRDTGRTRTAGPVLVIM